MSAAINKRQFRQECIQKWSASGLSIAKWCREHQVSYEQFFYWKSRLLPQEHLTRSSFIELPEGPNNNISGIHIECQGIRIHVAKNFDANTLLKCIAALRGREC